jgi:hypothetical protein
MRGLKFSTEEDIVFAVHGSMHDDLCSFTFTVNDRAIA